MRFLIILEYFALSLQMRANNFSCLGLWTAWEKPPEPNKSYLGKLFKQVCSER